ncbi:MAG: hypothetical protein HN377_12320, partial [Alphaproteobacteria bacterium]|nr:hypothetical protein [Alphaproteobacteria bacterium]
MTLNLQGAMSEVTPPPPPPPSPPSSAAAQPKAVVANPPEVFARQIALGARLEATITSTPQKGQFEIQTPFGRVLLQTTAPLPSDGTLQLQLQSKGAQLQFLITTINGQPPLAALRAEGLLPPLPGGLPGLPGNANTAPNVAQTPVL